MKTVKKIQLFILFLGLISFNACVESDDINTPVVLDETFMLGANDQEVSIAAVLGEYAQQGEIFTYEALPNGGSRYVPGYVVSSDEGGNFFEEIVIQNAASNPTAGIVVQVDVNPLFTFYEFGRKVWIKLDGLSVSEDNGVIQIGVRNGNDLEKIPSPLRNEHIIRDAEIATITPLELSIGEFSNDKESLFIRLTDVQFSRSEVLGAGGPLSFAAEATDQFDGERTLESCADNASVILSTSTFSDFKGLTLPQDRGTIDGILTRDFFDNFYTLVINSPEDINFDDPLRCDPGEFFYGAPTDCADTAVNGAIDIFSDDFEGYADTNELIAAGWTVVNVGGGSYTWGISGFGGNTYAIGNAFNTGEDNMDTWLISPEINLDLAPTERVLDFEIQTNFDGGEVMSVYISSDFVDTTMDANWSLLQDVTIPAGPASGFGAFLDAGPVNLTCVTGTVRIGFRYTGSASGVTTRYHVDDIEITGN